VGDLFSHSRIQLFDHGKLALQGVIQNQDYELRSAKNVRINEPDQFDHFVIIDIAPHIAQAVKAERRRDGKKQFVGKAIGDLFAANQRIDIVLGSRHETRIGKRAA
jgi:hypothetical protein